MRLTAATLALAALMLAAAPAHAQNAGQPRYLTQIQAELQAMGFAPQCGAANAQAGTCSVHVTSTATGGRRYLLVLQYDDNSDTIYTYVDHYGSIRADAPSAAQVFRRLLEMNWEMLIGRFEWSASSGEIRLSAVMNTDSNFDRRAFRGVVRSLLRLADRYADEVARITGNPVGDTSPAPATPAPAH